MKFIHELFRSMVIWSHTLSVLHIMVHPGRDRIELLIMRRTQHIRKTLLICFD